MKRFLVISVFAALTLGFRPPPAAADITVFFGVSPTPATRTTQGVAIGLGLIVVGFEFEYGKTKQDDASGAPGLTTGMGNVLLQTPFAILGFQPYATTGAGLYRERLGTAQHTGLGLNTGGGVKISLVGPVRLRVDYRVFKLGSGALHSPAHRIYAGLNLKF